MADLSESGRSRPARASQRARSATTRNIGLLPGGAERSKGRHRHYDADDVDRLRLIAGLRDLLGLSLEQLHTLVAAEGAWLVPNRPWREDESIAERSGVVDRALAQIDHQLDLLRAREAVLAELAQTLLERRQAIASKRITGD